MIKVLQFPFGIVELDARIEEETYDELARAFFYLFKYMEGEAA